MPYLETSNIPLFYDERGQGEPLLLVMGVGSQMIWWHEEFCDRLAGRGFRVIRFDNRDVGLSGKLTGRPRIGLMIMKALLGMPVYAPYDLRAMAGDAVALLDGLGIERAHVVGISMGGMIAQSLAIHHPERIHTLTSISSTTGSRRYWFVRPKTALSLIYRRLPTNEEQAVEGLVEFFRTLNGRKIHFDADHVRHLARQSFRRGQNPAGFVRQLAAILAGGDRTEALKKLAVPSLVIHGTEDPLIPLSAGKATAAAIPGAKLHMIEGMGHTLPHAIWDELIHQIAGFIGK